jgi:hypothetical protein
LADPAEFSGNAQTAAEQLTDNKITALIEGKEPEECYSMLFCSDATGK